MASKHYHNGYPIERKPFQEYRTVTAYLYEPAYDDLEWYCEQMDCSKAGFIRWLFDEYRDRNPPDEVASAERADGRTHRRQLSLYFTDDQMRDLDAYVSGYKTSRTAFLMELFNEFRRQNPVDEFDGEQLSLF